MRISDWSSDVCSSDLLANIDAVRSYIQQYDPGNAERFSSEFPPSDRGQTFTSTENNFAFYGQLNYGFDSLGFPIAGSAGVRSVNKIGSASCRERGLQYVSISGGAVSLTNKKKKNT